MACGEARNQRINSFQRQPSSPSLCPPDAGGYLAMLSGSATSATLLLRHDQPPQHTRYNRPKGTHSFPRGAWPDDGGNHSGLTATRAQGEVANICFAMTCMLICTSVVFRALLAPRRNPAGQECN
jgi:hypothetical protein